MNSVIASTPFSAPHLLQNNRLSPSCIPYDINNMASRKRKADDDGTSGDDRMSASPSNSPAPSSPYPQLAQSNRTLKRMRTNVTGRPLALPRLLETLGADEMRNLLRSICDRHPDIGAEVVSTAPRPSVDSTIGVLNQYESRFRDAFPFGGRASSDYAYNRVRQGLIDLLDALQEYTPHFLPPNETQAGTSLSFLDAATNIIHRLPDWDNAQHNRHKQEAYEEMAKAWALVIREAAKRAGGMQLQYGGWDQKLSKHNEQSGGRMQAAVNELRGSLSWMGTNGEGSNAGAGTNDRMAIRQQLLNGTYGMGMGAVGAGPW